MQLLGKMRCDFIPNIMSYTMSNELSNAYSALLSHCRQDPVFAALYDGEMAWADADTEHDITPIQPIKEAGLQDAIKRAMGNTTLNKFFPLLFNEPVAVNDSLNGIKTVIVRNLPRNITINTLHNLFDVHGYIHNIYIPKNMDKHSPYFGTVKGFAFIKFVHSAGSLASLQLDGISLYGKIITVEFANADRE